MLGGHEPERLAVERAGVELLHFPALALVAIPGVAAAAEPLGVLVAPPGLRAEPDAKAAAEKAAEELIKAEEREQESKKAFSGGIKKGFLDKGSKKK